MPVLTGTLRDVSGSLLAPEAVRRIFVKAPTLRGSYTGEALIVTKDVDLSPSGNVTVDLEPGPAVLVVYTDTSQDTFELWVTEDMETLSEAVAENDPDLPWQESRMKALLDEAVQQIIDAGVIAGDVEADRVAAEAARVGSETARDQSVTARNQSQGFRNEAEGFAADAEQSATDSAGSASASAGSASAAAGSASTAGTHRAAAETARTGAETARTGAETARTGAEAEADRAQGYAEDFDLTVTGTSTGAEGSNASVTVTGSGPAYSLSFTIPRGDKGEQGDPGEVTEAQLNAAVAQLVDGAPEALDTLEELATALGNDPNFATTVSTAIGERAKTTDVNAALAGKANTSHTHTTAQVSGLDSALAGAASTAQWSQVSGKPSTFPASAHTHPAGEIATSSGTASSSTFLRGDNIWATPTNTTYSVPTQAEAEAGTATTARAFSAQRARQSANAAIAAKFQVVSSLPGSPDPGTFYFIAE